MATKAMLTIIVIIAATTGLSVSEEINIPIEIKVPDKRSMPINA